jgi:WD40 repeat protein
MTEHDKKELIRRDSGSPLVYKKGLIGRGIQLAAETYSVATARNSHWASSPATRLKGHFVHKHLAEDGFQLQLGNGYVRQVYPIDTQRVVIVTLAGAGLYDWSSGQAEWKIDCLNWDAKLSPRSGYLAFSNQYGSGTSLWDLSTGHETIIPCKYDVKGIAFDNQESKLAIATRNEVSIYALASSQLCKTLSIDDGWCQGVCFDPGGKLLAVSTSGGHVQIWDVALGELVVQETIEDLNIGDLTFSENGEYLAGGGSNAIYAWSVQRANTTKLIPLIRDVYASEDRSAPSCILVTSTDQCLAAWEDECQWEMWDLPSRTRVSLESKLVPNFNLITSSYVQGGQLFIVGSNSSAAMLWNHTKQELVKQVELPGHHHAVTALQLVDDDFTLISGDKRGTVLKWKLKGNALPQTLWKSKLGIAAMQRLPSRQELVIVSYSGDVDIVDLCDGTPIKHTVLAGAITPGSKYIISGDGYRLAVIPDTGTKVVVYSLVSGDLEWEIKAKCNVGYAHLAFSTDSTVLAISPDTEQHDVLIYHLDKQAAFLISVYARVYGLSFTPDKSEVCIATENSIVGYDLKSCRKTWECRHTLFDYSAHGCMSYTSEDGRLFARTGVLQCLWVYDLHSQALVRIISGLFTASPGAATRAIAISMRSQVVAIGSRFGTIQLFQLAESRADAKKNAQEQFMALARSDSNIAKFKLEALQSIINEPGGAIAQLLTGTGFVEEALAELAAELNALDQYRRNK